MVNVDTIAAYSGGPAAHADGLGPKVGGRPALFCVDHLIW